jgi:hypothetical protein
MITSLVLERNYSAVHQYSLHQTDLIHLHYVKIHTSSTVLPSSSICEETSDPSLIVALLQPYGGGGVPGGVILGESTSQVLPVFTRFTPYDRSDNDSDAIKRSDAKKQTT